MKKLCILFLVLLFVQFNSEVKAQRSLAGKTFILQYSEKTKNLLEFINFENDGSFSISDFTANDQKCVYFGTFTYSSSILTLNYDKSPCCPNPTKKTFCLRWVSNDSFYGAIGGITGKYSRQGSSEDSSKSDYGYD